MAHDAVAEGAARLIAYRGGTTPLKPLGSFYLRRPFAPGATRRIVLVFFNHELAWSQYNAFLRYAPRFGDECGASFRAVEFGAAVPDHLARDATAVFVQAPYHIDQDALDAALAALKAQMPRAAISFFDWAAPTDIRFSAAVSDHVRAYVKKGVHSDLSRYRTPPRGHTELCDYYTERFGLENPEPTWTDDISIIPRLRVGPAFSMDRRLAPLFERPALPRTERDIDVHARIATKGTPWYSAMRREAADVGARAFAGLTVASEGKVDRKTFMDELGRSKLCFSPFGYGEICWRDFEAIAAGAVLVKPDMSHVATDPDIYRDGETYLAVKWDLSDLEEVVHRALSDGPRMRRIADNAFRTVREHLHGDRLVHLVEDIAGRQAPVRVGLSARIKLAMASSMSLLLPAAYMFADG